MIRYLIITSVMMFCFAISKSEPWGLVIEEAMNNGLPVIVSNKVGCSIDLVAEDVNGIIFDLDDRNSLKNAVLENLRSYLL